MGNKKQYKERQAMKRGGKYHTKNTRKANLAKANKARLNAVAQVIDVLSMDDIDPIIVSENDPGNASMCHEL